MVSRTRRYEWTCYFVGGSRRADERSVVGYMHVYTHTHMYIYNWAMLIRMILTWTWGSENNEVMKRLLTSVFMRKLLYENVYYCCVSSGMLLLLAHIDVTWCSVRNFNKAYPFSKKLQVILILKLPAFLRIHTIINTFFIKDRLKMSQAIKYTCRKNIRLLQIYYSFLL